MDASPCKCGSQVFLFATHGGRGNGDTTAYAVECPNCGRLMEDIPTNASGRKRDAIAEWNRSRRASAMTPEPRDLTERRCEAIARRRTIMSGLLQANTRIGPAMADALAAGWIGSDPLTKEHERLTALLERARKVLVRAYGWCDTGSDTAKEIDALLTDLKAKP
jgi:hypothetical protein